MAATVESQTSLEAQVSRTDAAAAPATEKPVAVAPEGTAPDVPSDPKASDRTAATHVQASIQSAQVTPPRRARRRWILLGAALTVVAAGAYFVSPWIVTAFNTISTD